MKRVGLIRAGLLFLALASLLVGPWAQFAPHSFWKDFPGFGRAWVSADGPYNEHLVRDVGGLNLGLAVVAIWALVAGSVLLSRAVGAAALVFGLPHLLYHVTHLDPFETTDALGNVVALALTLAAALLALAAPARPRDREV